MTGPDAVRARFACSGGLPVADVLTEASILGVLSEHGVEYRDRVFGPVTTTWGFLSRVLSDDHSGRDTAARVAARRAASGLAACSPNTASYCNARGRLHTAVLRTLARRTAQRLQDEAADQRRWNGRRVFIAGGSHVSMPDTPENQASYPQPEAPRPGIGFPPARVAVLLSLATGACHDLAIAPYTGKGTGETSLPRAMYDTPRPGDVVLADAPFDNYFPACELRGRGVDLVAHAQYRRVGARTLRRGPSGDLLVWQRPNRPHGMKGEQYRTCPKTLRMRQVTADARDDNNRVERFEVIATILDESVDGGEVGDLYRRRWDGEVDTRSIKATMRMDVLRCKTPGLVVKEIRAHVLACDLLRTVMAVAAAEAGIPPREVSFKGARQAVTAFAPTIEAARPEDRPALVDALLAVVAYRRVGDRPGRWEPRARERRPKPGSRLTQPRAATRLRQNRKKWY